MNIAIIGAGIIGVTTAYELAADGHAVTVFERHASVAEEASFANAGVIAPGWSEILTSDRSPHRSSYKAPMNWLGLRGSGPPNPSNGSGLTPLQGLALYSHHRLHEVSRRLAYTFDRKDGCLVLLRSAKELRATQPRLALAREFGIPFHEISAVEARQIEPALRPQTNLAGAVYFPQAEVGNCRQFAVIVRDAAEQLGARFEFNSTVAAVESAPMITLRLKNESNPKRFDAVVLCTGTSARNLLKPLGIHFATVALHGYSISAPISETLNAPRSGVIDDRHQVSITRLGKRVRVAGPIKASRDRGKVDHSAVRDLYKVLADWYPLSASLSKGVQLWKGSLHAFSDALPRIGSTHVPGVWLNMGHGEAGWTLACGSARELADQIEGRPHQFPLSSK